jgi:hypothetical protein
MESPPRIGQNFEKIQTLFLLLVFSKSLTRTAMAEVVAERMALFGLRIKLFWLRKF